MSNLSKTAAKLNCVSFGSDTSLFALPACMLTMLMAVASFVLLVVELQTETSVTERLLQVPGVWPLLLFAFVLTAISWWYCLLRQSPVILLGQEGMKVDLRAANVRSRWLLRLMPLSRFRFGLILWDQIRSVEAIDRITEFDYQNGLWGGLVIKGTVWRISKDGSPADAAPVSQLLSISPIHFSSSPATVAAQIQSYLDDPNLHQSLPSLFES